MVEVFISYSRTDLAAVTRLAQAVEAAGYEVWWDADLPPHLSYGDVITNKIGAARAAIVVWSKDSAASEWVRAEADMARNQKKLIQTALGDIMPPLPFNQIQFAEIGDWHGEADHPGWRKVKASLAELCGPREPAETRSDPPLAAASHQTPAPLPAGPSKWPLYAGVGIGAAALAVAGWALLRENRPDQPSDDAARSASPAPPASAVAPSSEPMTLPAAAPVAAPTTLPMVAPVAAPDPVEPPAPAPPPPVASTEGMLFPDSSRRLLTPADIGTMGPATLELARNEIYARKGKRFRRADLRNYFSQFDWYRPTSDNVRLTAIEQQNVARLHAAEARYGQ